MKINLSHIIEGWRNHLIPSSVLKEKILEISNQRLEICRRCEYNSVNAPGHTWLSNIYEHCTNCGCPLVQKTKCLSEGCEMKRWDAVLTEQEEDLLNIDEDGQTDKVEEDSSR